MPRVEVTAMSMTDDQFVQALSKKFHPDAIRANLVRAGLFLTGWEMLKSEIEKKVQGFFWEGFDSRGQRYSKSYQTDVLSRHESRFQASLLWLVEQDAVTEAKATRIREMREHRNEIAHELRTVLIDPEHAGVDLALLREMRDIIAALGVFWGRIEVDTNEDFVAREIADADIKSVVSLLMDYLVAAAEDAAPAPVAP
jgi:hypothetical protein